MNKKALILLVLVAITLYYLNQEEPKSRKSLPSEPWIIPKTKKAEKVLSPKPQITSAPKPKEEFSIKWPSDETVEEIDYSWLSDDNLAYILKNWTPIKEALKTQNQTQKKFRLRTDLANIYNSFQKALSKQDWDLPEFLSELAENKHQYTLFPVRVNGNHWGLFILSEEKEIEPEEPMEPGVICLPRARMVKLVTKVYYTSSGGVSLETEKKQLQPFIEQIVGERVSIEIITPKDRNSKGYECGVYLCFYVREILESGKLQLKRTYSEKECQEFRREWKERIGERWGRWD